MPRRLAEVGTRRRFRSLLATAPLFLSALAQFLGGGCDGDAVTPKTVADDSGTADDTGTAPSICPLIAPEAGEGCLLPEGTTCAFGACGTPIAECRLGAWRYGGNPPPRPPCPAEPPPAESACPPCWPASIACDYGTCGDGDASTTNKALAACPNGTWVLSFVACSDAGADVQDASMDAPND